MNVSIISRNPVEAKKGELPKVLQEYGPVGEMVPYTNKVKGEADPYVRFPNGHFLFPDTIRRRDADVIEEA